MREATVQLLDASTVFGLRDLIRNHFRSFLLWRPAGQPVLNPRILVCNLLFEERKNCRAMWVCLQLYRVLRTFSESAQAGLPIQAIHNFIVKNHQQCISRR